MDKFNTALYGLFWLYLLNPIFIGLLVGAIIENHFKSLVMFLLWIPLCYMYYYFIWMRVRRKFYKMDRICVNAYLGRKL